MPSSSQEYQGLGIPATSSADWLGSYNRSRFLNNTESRVTTAAKINDLDGDLNGVQTLSPFATRGDASTHRSALSMP